MAGDWIKMRVDLHTHPKVVRIVSAVCPQDVRKVSARCLVVGALHAMWSLFDAHSIDGELRGYGPETLDALVGLDGFAAGVAAVEWLVITPNSLAMPNFGTHNGKGAKRRAEDTAAKRVRRMSEECPQEDRTDCGPEKRREKKRRDNAAAAISPTAGEAGETLAAFGIASPAREELAALGLTSSQIRRVCESCKSHGKGVGVMVLELRAAADAQHAKQAAVDSSRATLDRFRPVWAALGQNRLQAKETYLTANPHMRQYTGGPLEDLPRFQEWVIGQYREVTNG